MTSPPDAVSGAATPAQQADEAIRCKHCGHPVELWTYRYQSYWTHVGFDRACRLKAEPAATPEAQIPECVHAPETGISLAPLHDMAAHYLDRYTKGFWASYALELLRRIKGTESQLAALRVERDAMERERDKFLGALECANKAAKRRGVERDRAWNEARQLAQGVVNEYSECFFDEKRPKLQYCYTHNTKHCTQKQTNELATQILARPIPAEPEEKGAPNGVD